MNMPPTIVVIFGGAGDLTWRKLIPSLFDLLLDGRMPQRFAIVAVDRIVLSDAAFRLRLRGGARKFCRKGRIGKRTSRSTSTGSWVRDWNRFARHITYRQGTFTDRRIYDQVALICAAFSGKRTAKTTIVFHLATPPDMIDVISRSLAAAGLAKDREHVRIVVEKPIGHDLESAMELNATLTRSFHESQIFRIDHYLGKETVQNILAFRFANPLFEPIWNRRYVDHVTITVAETVGVGHRGGYYDHSGALRDMIQNHLMQLMCLVAMEPVISYEANEIRDKKLDVLEAVRPIPRRSVDRHAVRGQYAAGVCEGQRVRAYRREADVSPRSTTETFAGVKLFIDNWRWEGVPFFLITGKRLKRQVSDIVIQFRDVPHHLFPFQSALDRTPSRLAMTIQPDEAITLGFKAKQPGPSMAVRPVEMQFNYHDSFRIPSPEAYETLLYDVMNNDQTLFMRSDQVEAAWSIVMPILSAWTASSVRAIPAYPAGSWGPRHLQSIFGSGATLHRESP
jgi:glucose-6-phosphate 1-dehydrogenase